MIIFIKSFFSWVLVPPAFAFSPCQSGQAFPPFPHLSALCCLPMNMTLFYFTLEFGEIWRWWEGLGMGWRGRVMLNLIPSGSESRKRKNNRWEVKCNRRASIFQFLCIIEQNIFFCLIPGTSCMTVWLKSQMEVNLLVSERFVPLKLDKSQSKAYRFDPPQTCHISFRIFCLVDFFYSDYVKMGAAKIVT